MRDIDNKPYPLPRPTEFTRPFWDACQKQDLIIWACANCAHRFLPGGPVCPNCWSADLSTKSVSGQGEVFSYVIYRRDYHPSFPAPYVVALIALSEGPRLISNIVDCAAEQVHIGQKVKIKFESEDGFILPRFSPLEPVSARKDNPHVRKKT